MSFVFVLMLRGVTGRAINCPRAWTTFLGPVALSSSNTYVVEHAIRWWMVETDSEQWVVHHVAEVHPGPLGTLARFNPPDMQPGDVVRFLRGLTSKGAAKVSYKNAVNFQTDADGWHGTFIVRLLRRRAKAVDCGPDSSEPCSPSAAKAQSVECSLSRDGTAACSVLTPKGVSPGAPGTTDNSVVPSGLIRITSTPESAEIYVDDAFVGSCPAVLHLTQENTFFDSLWQATRKKRCKLRCSQIPGTRPEIGGCYS
jgi:hypothetical protein